MQPTLTATSHLRNSRLAAYIELLHLPPIIVVLAAAALLTTAADYPPSVTRLTLFLGALLASQLAISIHNDYCDRILDAAVKPWRAFPRHLITPTQALTLVALLLLAAVALAAPLGLDVVALGIIGTGSAFAYNAALKRTLWVWVPFWIALPTVALAAFTVAGQYTDRLPLAYLVGLPLALAAYLTDTIDDADLDRASGVHSLTATLGAKHSRLLAWLSLLSADLLAAASFANLHNLPLFAIPIALLAAAILTSTRTPRLHWALMMAAIVAVAGASAVALNA